MIQYCHDYNIPLVYYIYKEKLKENSFHLSGLELESGALPGQLLSFEICIKIEICFSTSQLTLEMRAA